MSEEHDNYPDVRKFMWNAGHPATAAGYLLEFQNTVTQAQPQSLEDASYWAFCARMVEAVAHPSESCTDEQRDFLQKTRECASKLRAMQDAGWLTSYEEGKKAFDPKQRPIDWSGPNPYSKGTDDYVWWQDGYESVLHHSYQSEVLTSDMEVTGSVKSTAEMLKRLSESVERETYGFIALWAVFQCQYSYCNVVAFCISMALANGQQITDESVHTLRELLSEFQMKMQDSEYEKITSFVQALEDFEAFTVRVGEVFEEIGQTNKSFVSDPVKTLDSLQRPNLAESYMFVAGMPKSRRQKGKQS